MLCLDHKFEECQIISGIDIVWCMYMQIKADPSWNYFVHTDLEIAFLIAVWAEITYLLISNFYWPEIWI